MTVKRTAAMAVAVLMLAAMPGAALAQEQPAEEVPRTQERAATPEERAAQRVAIEADWVEKLKARALEAIDKRLATLAELERVINDSESLTAEHADTLLAEVDTAAAGLARLAEEIGTAQDLDTLRALVPRIFEDYRVYAIVVPKVHLVIGADAAIAVASRLTAITESIGDILNRLEEAGFDVGEGYRLLDQMKASVTSGSGQAEAVAPAVIGLSPDDYPASTEVLREAHEKLKGAGSELRTAGETAHDIGQFIKGLFGGDED